MTQPIRPASGDDLIRFLEGLEKGLKYNKKADKFVDALIKNHIDQDHVQPNWGRKILEIYEKIVDPRKEFEEFRDALAKTAEERIDDFAQRLLKSTAVNEAWVQKHQASQERKRLTTLIVSTKREIGQKQSALQETEKQLEDITQQIASKTNAIADAESVMRQERYLNLEQKKRNTLPLKLQLEKAIGTADGLIAKYQNINDSQAREIVYEAQKAKADAVRKLAIINQALKLADENIQFREKCVRQINRLRQENQTASGKRNELTRQNNHLQQEINELQSKLATLQAKQI